MKWMTIAACGLIACGVISCSPVTTRTTDKMGNDLAVARSGPFAECIRMASLASDSMQEAEFFKTKIDASVAGREDWYYDTGESAASRAIEQRRKAEQACGDYLATKYAYGVPTSALANADERIFFNTGSADITPTEREKLSKVISTLKREPASTVVISGYTDTTGSTALNNRLSTRRAANVFETLKELGKNANVKVVPERIEVLGRGEAGGPDQMANAEDRRVDIILVPSTARARMK